MELKLHTINTLKVKGLEIATCSGDLSVLVIEGEPTGEELKDCWLCINSDYSEMTGDAQTRQAVENGLRVYELSGRILMITMLVEAMRAGYSKAIHAALEAEGYSGDFDPEDPKGYEADLTEVMMWLKADEIELGMLEAEDNEEEDEPAAEKVKTVTPEYFDDLLMEIYTNLLHAAVGDTEKIKEDMTVATLARYVKRLKKYYATPKPAAMPHY